jgi:ATP-dependent Clp protease adaptor protein ClpS
MANPDYQNEDAVLSETREKLEKPPLYKVLIHNDDFTTMEFVVVVLRDIFNRPEGEAFRIMLQVHMEGVGVAGVYTYEIAQMKAEKATSLARENEFPLLFTIEEE